MQHYNSIKNFEYEADTKCLVGRVVSPSFNLINAEIIVENIKDINGYVVELFSIIEPIHGEHRVQNIKFKKGDWFVKILVSQGNEYFEKNKIKDFILKYREPSKIPFEKPKISDPNTILLELKNISGLVFGKYYIDIRGGETGGIGRNEHGEPHFHIIEFKTNIDLGKVYFPSLKDYKEKNIEPRFICNLKSKEKKLINKWIFENNENHLIKMNEIWQELNKDNNRIV